MSVQSLLALAQNAAMLLSMVLIFDVVSSRWRLGPRPPWKALIGLMMGAIGIGIMLTPLRYSPDVVFDTRSILLGLVGLFFGAIPAAIAMAMTITMRFHLGGSGAWTGASVILASGVTGILWRHCCRRPLHQMSWQMLYVFGMVVHVIMLALMLTLPGDTALHVLADISLPVILIYPASTALLGVLLVSRLRREKMAEDLLAHEAKLLEKESFSRSVMDAVGANIAVVDKNGWIKSVNRAWRQFAQENGDSTGGVATGVGANYLKVTQAAADQHTDNAAEALAGIQRLLVGGASEFSIEYPCDSPDQKRWFMLRGTPLKGESGGAVLAHINITERKLAEAHAEAAAAETRRLLAEAEQSRRALLSMLEDQKRGEEERAALEDRVRQQQRLETVGQLAAGVAHDFNNILTGIIGFTRFALSSAPEGSSASKDLSEVLALAKRAADLTRQLLAFSRRQTLQMCVININELVGNLTKMIGRLLGEQIDLVFALAADLGNVKADAGQIEQILMNLAVNARDAMPNGGRLTISTANVELDEEYARTHDGVQAGPHVMFAVSDSGAGMAKAVRARLFEPFFTTKGVGKGTGLGLATVYGIVKQHGGSISVYSELGKGTTFKVYLRRVGENVTAETSAAGPSLPRGSETVLIVEDEAAVREIAARSLSQHGYRVLAASRPSEAEELLAAHGSEIALLLTDVVMPEHTGREFYESVRDKYPNLRVLYMSGYTDSAIAHQGLLDPDTAFIQKPFTLDALLRKVREVIGGNVTTHGDTAAGISDD